MRKSRRLGAGLMVVVSGAAAVLAMSGGASASEVAPVISHRPESLAGVAQSQNWGGYAQGSTEKHTQFHSVTGTWIVPTATPRKAGEQEYSSDWVGIGGSCRSFTVCQQDMTLIQAGTGQTVNEPGFGPRHYYAWYELIPKSETRVSLPVAPGQKVSVSITETSTNKWTIVIRNLSTGKSFTKIVPFYKSGHGSVEWIEERPLLTFSDGSSSFATLPKLSKVTFSGATVNGAPAGLVTNEEIRLVNNSGARIVTPSAPHGSTSFNACSYTTVCS